MNKKTLFSALIAFLFITVGYSQKVKIKKDIITIDKVEYGKIEKDDVSRGAFYINNLDGDNLLYLKWVDWGQYGYYEIYKADDLDNVLFETESGIGYKKWISKKLYSAKALTTEGINEEKLNQFAKKMGREFSRRRAGY